MITNPVFAGVINAILALYWCFAAIRCWKGIDKKLRPVVLRLFGCCLVSAIMVTCVVLRVQEASK